MRDNAKCIFNNILKDAKKVLNIDYYGCIKKCSTSLLPNSFSKKLSRKRVSQIENFFRNSTYSTTYQKDEKGNFKEIQVSLIYGRKTLKYVITVEESLVEEDINYSYVKEQVLLEKDCTGHKYSLLMKEMKIEALDKQIPVKPEDVFKTLNDNLTEYSNSVHAICPRCKSDLFLDQKKDFTYCPECGQKIDWRT